MRSERSDEGFTLVELVASLTVLAIGIVAVIGVMNSSFRVAGTASSRAKGVAVASAEIERLRAIPYKQLPVQLPTEDAQVRTETVGGRTFTIKSTVTLEDEQTGATRTDDAYRKAFVWVNWQDEAGTHDVYQTTLIYPGGLGVFNAATTFNPSTAGGSPSPPTNLTATPLSNVTGVDLSWTPPAPASPPPVAWVVQVSKDPTFPLAEIQEVTATLPVAITMLRVDDLAPATNYHFRVYSKAENGRLSSQSAQALNIMTGLSAATVCSVGTATVTPAALHKKNGRDGSGLNSNPRVEVSTLGPCTGLTFRMEYSPRGDVVDDIALVAGTNGTFSASVQGTTQAWEVGEHEINIYSYNSSNLKTKRATLRLIVCDSQKKACP